MSKRPYRPEEIIAKLREADVLSSQGGTIVCAVKQMELGIPVREIARKYRMSDKTV